MADFEVKVEDAEVLTALKRLINLGKNMEPAMGDIAAIGENSVHIRFRTGTAPDGSRWKPSLRAQINGGKTLIKDAHLVQSTSSNHGRDYAEWGVNRPDYAAIHQFGGTIKPKSTGGLRFKLANGAFVTARQVNMPARPFLGVSDTDKSDILDAIESRIRGATWK